uniref:Uncharacterized protein n=1 Tax=viral metagenome TaxID=1070528 RepID=A0A6C0C7H0_9ZZZZ
MEHDIDFAIVFCWRAYYGIICEMLINIYKF